MGSRLRGACCGPCLAVLMLAAPAGAQDARLTGCSTDPSNSPLPGVTVFAQRDGRTVQAVTGDDGCYVTPPLSPGSYRLLACLPGFVPVGRNEVGLTAGRSETWNFVLRVGPINEQIYISRLVDLWKLADVVVRVRTNGYRFGPDSDISASAIHDARIVTAWKSDSRLPNGTVTFRQGLEGECRPYEPGTELFLFLRWNDAEGVFDRVGRINGAFTVAAGRLGYGIESYVGKDVAALIADLDALRDGNRPR